MVKYLKKIENISKIHSFFEVFPKYIKLNPIPLGFRAKTMPQRKGKLWGAKIPVNNSG